MALYDGGDNDGRTIAVALSDAGYRTGLYGKYLNHYEVADSNVAPPIPPGWTNWFSFVGKNGGYYDYTISDQGHVEDTGGEARTTRPTCSAARPEVSSAEGIQDGSRPFFLYFAPYAPHGRAVPGPVDHGVRAPIPFESGAFNERTVSDKPPFVSDTGLIGAVELANHARWWNRMYGALVDVDRWVGKFERTLPAPVLADTVFVFLSDNGVEWGDHRLEFKGYPYERSIRVPLIIAGPGIEHGVNRSLASNLDIAPTIMDLTGVTPPGPFDGTSLVPALAGTGQIKTKAVLLEHMSLKWAPSYCGLRTRRWKTSSTAAVRTSCTTSAVTPTSCTTWPRASHACDIASTLGHCRRANPCRPTGIRPRRRSGLAVRSWSTASLMRIASTSG